LLPGRVEGIAKTMDFVFDIVITDAVLADLELV